MPGDENGPDRAGRAAARVEKAAQLERDRQGAWADIAAAAHRQDENTLRLRALRLAREQSEAVASAAEPAKKTIARKRRRRMIQC